ncbi:trans-sulfuration enzyme family protein [Bifidobacterium tissieri]|uniref:homocysteine desulfhydrase n=2 Tax=Bifidobacterium tissieri TaxID=1630162 RepID=A0A5M9ZWB1_9BIFI|nr:aminotransferase class I/II-fold pyridoxal phosphate-dependent enzyme [Bifidobacterium tissieri]KAA8831142.1 aminotransferase class I/II-fold pyridoxal phosphate-dependent enzyme [Bifidobacterium tissieri]KAA8833202.1 aminotransferase class I/II-fold pyridoxal phosphate-dependent enzyme [Bifidobacterium tissieri]
MTSDLTHQGVSFDDKPLGFNTLSIHLGNGVDAETGAIRRPITLANAYALPYDPSDINWSSSDVNLYTRNGHPNQRYLEAKLAKLEGAEDAVVLASGVAALSATFTTFLNRGDHAVFSDTTYIAAYRLLEQILPEKYGIETSIVDTSDPANVAAALKPNTKLVHIETPANPTLKVSDIKTIAALVHDHNPEAVVSVDNTFNSPFNVRPLDLGADIVIESLTKYINGHGDALGGAIATTKERTDQIRFTAQVNYGGIISPFNAWLINRGSVTLPLRMRQHNASALAIAQHLESLPQVRFVAYPGLESHPHHDVAVSQLARPDAGFGGVLAFGLDTDHDGHNRFVSKLNVITSAVSLGHDESLIVFLGEDDERQYLYPEEFHRGFFRLAVGLEDTDDLIRDIDHALAEAGLA